MFFVVLFNLMLNSTLKLRKRINCLPEIMGRSYKCGEAHAWREIDKGFSLNAVLDE